MDDRTEEDLEEEEEEKTRRREEEDSAEKKKRRKKKKQQHSFLKLEELQNHLLENESLHNRNCTEHTENQDIHEGKLHTDIADEERKIKKKKKKKKKRDDMDGKKGQEQQQQEDQLSQQENVHAENNKGEKKRGKKKKDKKREDEVDQHFEEGNLHRENNKEERRRSKKKEKKEKKEEEEEEKTETPLPKIPTQISCRDYEQRKEKKAGKLAKENGLGVNIFEGVVYANEKMTKKAKQSQDVLCKFGGEVGSDGGLKEGESASSKATKHSKKSRNFVERGGYDPASNEEHDLLSNNSQCSKGPLADQLEHVANTSMTIDSCPKDKEKGKKKERKRKRVTFQDQINVADEEHARDVPNVASENSLEIAEEVWGVRFTAEEDEILKDAVWKYIKSKGWDEQEGLNKVFNSQKHKDARNCWADIKLSLPHRPRAAIRYRAHLLLEKGAHAGKWSAEEEQLLKRENMEASGKSLQL